MTYGIAYKYSGCDCDGTAINSSMINETDSFDCTSEDSCDVFEFERTVYCTSSASVGCNADCLEGSYDLALTDGAICVYDSAEDRYVSTVVEDGFLSLRFYVSSDNDCNDGAETIYNFSDGCHLENLTGRYAEYRIFEYGTDGGQSVTILNQFVCIAVVMLAICVLE